MIKKKITINLENCLLTKQSQPSLMEIEHEKHTKGYLLGIKSCLFKVPKIHRYNRMKGILVMDYFPNIQKFNKIKNPSQELIVRIAKSLSFIHDNMILKKKMSIKEVYKIGSKFNSYIHGDFNGDNVCVDKLNNDIVILDWQSPSRFDKPFNYHDRLFDVFWFATFNLWKLNKVNLNFLKLINNSILFIQSYINFSKEKININYVLTYGDNFYRASLINQKKKKRLKIKEILIFNYSKLLNILFFKFLKRIKKK